MGESVINAEDDCWLIDDWFEVDKEQILCSLNRKTLGKCKKNIGKANVIENRSTKGRQPLTQRLANKADVEDTLSIRRLNEIYNLTPLSIFLYITTETEPDFFEKQLTERDDMERVLLYTQILVKICQLELPGFHRDLLRKVAICKPLMFHFENIALKMFSKRFKTMWSDLERVDRIIYYMQHLLLQAQKANVLTREGMQLLFKIWTLIKANENEEIGQREICQQFAEQLKLLFSVDEDILSEPVPADEIYPTHDEMLQWCRNQSGNWPDPKAQIKFDSVEKYINSQKYLLREHFLLPLREVVRQMCRARNLKDAPEQQIAYENVEIKLNKNFEDVNRFKLVYVDILAGERRSADEKLNIKKSEYQFLESLKCGALLCFTSNYDFEKVIFATVSFTNTFMLRHGYIAIIIMRQYNIGNIYGQRLIMFEAPCYFEPYVKSYQYLNNCNVLNFPMARYIVQGQTEAQSPAYLQSSHPAMSYQNQKFEKKFKNLPLNNSQRNAFYNSLTKDFSLIQGPPGTGKTHLSLQLLTALISYAKTSMPIVLITYTNESLDKFLLKLSSYTDSIVRFGSQTRLPEIAKYNARADTNTHLVNPRLKRLYWMVKLKFKNDFSKLQMLSKAFDSTDESYHEILATQQEVWNGQEKLNTIRSIFQHYLVRNKRVIAMTTTCASRMNFVFRFLKSRIVVFEEAAEIMEAHILPCLTPYTEQVVMIGDHMQLKPFSSLSYLKGFHNVNISLFERLICIGFKASMLKTQYRMHRSIADLLCPVIYEELHSDDVVDSYPNVRNMSKNLFFLSHNESESQSRSSLYNTWELDQIIVLVRFLLEVSAYTVKDIVVLSPYKKQVELIKLIFSNIPNLADIIVSTVDSFQGMEANIVVLSLVRSNKQGRIGFLNEQNRICVAISRAKHGLYIIGNMEILVLSPVWRDIRNKLIKQNAIGNEFPYAYKVLL